MRLSLEFSTDFKVEVGQKVIVKKLGDYVLEGTYEAIFTNQDDRTVGLNTLIPFPGDGLDQFYFVERSLPADSKKFYSDHQFLVAAKENVKSVRQKLEKKPKRAQVLKILELQRESSRYLKNQVELLCEM